MGFDPAKRAPLLAGLRAGFGDHTLWACYVHHPKPRALSLKLRGSTPARSCRQDRPPWLPPDGQLALAAQGVPVKIPCGLAGISDTQGSVPGPKTAIATPENLEGKRVAVTQGNDSPLMSVKLAQRAASTIPGSR